MGSQPQKIREAIKHILSSKQCHTQNDIALELRKIGFDNLSQSQVSRFMSKLGAVRTMNSNGEFFYTISAELTAPKSANNLASLVMSIHSNNHLVVVKTVSAAAQLVGRMLDTLPNDENTNIMGVLCGDDTLFVAPFNTKPKDMARLKQYIQDVLTVK